MVEFSDLFESEEEGFVKKAKVGITSIANDYESNIKQFHSISALSLRESQLMLQLMASKRVVNLQTKLFCHFLALLTCVSFFSQTKRSPKCQPKKT